MAVKVLQVEDDRDQALLFAQVLNLSGYDVTTVDTAEEAQTRITETPFALLLVDWDLGSGMKGDDLIRWVKTHAPGIKTILFSNHAQVDEYAATCGADAWFRKIDGIVPLRRLVAQLVPPDNQA